ncbi:MAG: molybdenum cofactor synthesis domain-containing protein [Fusobacteria bacterium]|nr:MAG: molybdenum cofactor synthesis domain-containing protein [Fusobacteriota bacterium]KAF0229646.1 MAG: molybdenum cofactor synthesis domain-containing [Fusobacteriota bacterium]
MFRIGILTASDAGSRGEREDLSSKVIMDMITSIGEVVEYIMVPDNRDDISAVLKLWADELKLDLILTTGGTGFSPRDITPEATLDIVERQVPGIPEALRAMSYQKTNRAMLSRGTAGIRGATLIVNMPGSPIACREYMEFLLPVLSHGLEILTGKAANCARPEK